MHMYICSTKTWSPPGSSELVGSQRLVYKIKKFLSTLIKFGLDISPQVGDKVRDMVLNLVVSIHYRHSVAGIPRY